MFSKFKDSKLSDVQQLKLRGGCCAQGSDPNGSSDPGEPETGDASAAMAPTSGGAPTPPPPTLSPEQGAASA